MHSLNVVFAYMAPQQSLPVTSVLVFMVGVVLMFGRSTFRLATRWVRLARTRMTRNAPGEPVEGAHLLDTAPTPLELGSYDVPPSMRGRSLVAGNAVGRVTAGWTLEGEEPVRSRHSGLG
jgi:hypothetical protein